MTFFRYTLRIIDLDVPDDQRGDPQGFYGYSYPPDFRLTGFTGVSLAPSLSAVSGISITVPRESPAYAAIYDRLTTGHMCYVQIWCSLDGVAYFQLNDSTYVLGFETVTFANRSASATFTGRSAACRLEDFVIHELEDGDQDPYYPTVASTAAEWMGAVMRQAYREGYLRGMGMNFSDVDATGAPWERRAMITLTPGQTALDVLNALVSAELCEFRVLDRQSGIFSERVTGFMVLELANPGGFGKDRSRDDAGVYATIFDGQSMAESSSVARDSFTRPTRFSVLGEYGTSARRDVASGRRIFPRWAFERRDDVFDDAAAASYAEARAYQLSLPNETITINGLDAQAAGVPTPFRDFALGDRVRYRLAEGVNGSSRVQSIGLSLSMDGTLARYDVTLAENPRLPRPPRR